MLTIKEVAQAANVSVATVSRVLNHDKRVALKTKEHVLKVVKELDYTPNTLGRNLRVSATKKILVLLPSVLNQFFSSVMQGIEESVQARGYQVMMSTTRSDPQIEQSYIEFLYNKSIDGIIFLILSRRRRPLTGFQKNILSPSASAVWREPKPRQ